MKFLPAKVEVSDDEGFSREKDIFERRSFAEGLTNLVTKSEDPLVLFLDSAWGTGKTVFIKMWAGELRKKDIPVIYFDAFENDHVENAFVAIAAEVIGLAEKFKKTDSSAYKTYLKRAGRLGGVLFRAGSRIGVKAATLGAIDIADFDALGSVADDIAKETSTRADQYVESILKLQSQEKASIESLRSSLADLAKELSGVQGSPLVFIIDELDRCRPNFALDVIEQVKHIFSIPNVHFILSAQLNQLENSVRFTYGVDIDARTYLQKFYSLVVNFPERGRFRNERSIPKFMNHLCQSMDLDKESASTIEYFAEMKGLSFRTIERIATCVSIARAFVPKNHLWIVPIVAVLCVMKVVSPRVFQRARDGRIGHREVKDFILPPDSEAVDTEFNTEWVMAWWDYCLSQDEPDRQNGAVSAIRNYLFSFHVDRQRIIPVMAGYLDSFQSEQS